MSKADLTVDWATHAAAKYACEKWHYSKCMPPTNTVKLGVWENKKYIGVVVFSHGANKDIGSPYGLKSIECCELVRIALTSHISFVSRILSIAIKFLIKNSPNLKLIISYADPEQGHHGGVYQACNWIYSSTTKPTFVFKCGNKILHKCTYTGIKKSPLPAGAIKKRCLPKHRYLMPLDEETRAKILPLAKPYPKRPKQAMADSTGTAAGSADLDAPLSQPICSPRLISRLRHPPKLSPFLCSPATRSSSASSMRTVTILPGRFPAAS